LDFVREAKHGLVTTWALRSRGPRDHVALATTWLLRPRGPRCHALATTRPSRPRGPRVSTTSRRPPHAVTWT